VDILYSNSLFRNAGFNGLMFVPEISNWIVFLNGKHPSSICMSCLLVQNRPFPSYLVPLFQSKSLCKAFHMKMTLICMKMKL